MVYILPLYSGLLFSFLCTFLAHGPKHIWLMPTHLDLSSSSACSLLPLLLLIVGAWRRLVVVQRLGGSQQPDSWPDKPYAGYLDTVPVVSQNDQNKTSCWLQSLIVWFFSPPSYLWQGFCSTKKKKNLVLSKFSCLLIVNFEVNSWRRRKISTFTTN